MSPYLLNLALGGGRPEGGKRRIGREGWKGKRREGRERERGKEGGEGRFEGGSGAKEERIKEG